MSNFAKICKSVYQKPIFVYKNCWLNYLKGKPLTIRTLDVGNDKKVPSIEKFLSKSPNPALGLRAIRLTLAFPRIFKRQIAAILRASKFGNIKIMLPMISNVSELLEVRKLISEVERELNKKKNYHVAELVAQLQVGLIANSR